MPGTTCTGRFLWYELLTSDPSRSESFYSRLLGWQPRPWEGSEPPYTMWTVGGQPIGGLMELPEEAREQGAPSHWLPYLGTDDVDATAERARELGAETMVPPTDIPDVGRFSVLKDPQGALFAIYTPSSEPGDEGGEPGFGHVSWNELGTTDHEAALAFYGELMGWGETNTHDMGDMGVYRIYGTPERDYGGMYDLPAGTGAPPAWLMYVMVPDVDEVAEKVTDLGGTVINGPMDVPGGGRVAQCLDPTGAAFALHAKGS